MASGGGSAAGHGHPNGKKLMRERKTVCSLHPMTTNEFSHLEALNNLSCCSVADPAATATIESSLNHVNSAADWENEDAAESQCSSSFPPSADESRRGSAISSTRYAKCN